MICISGPEASLSSIPELQNQSVTIGFPCQAKGVPSYELTGAVVRISRNSLGIAITDFPMNAYGALSETAQRNAYTLQKTSPQWLHPGQKDALIAECHAQYLAFIQRVFAAFYEELENKLIQAAYEADNFTEKRLFSTIYPLVASRRTETEQAFLDASYLEQRFDQYPASADQYQREQLALVDADDFEDWLNISHVINELCCEHQSLLEYFEIRYRTLPHRADPVLVNPYGPYFIFQTFRKAVMEIDLPFFFRAWMYKAFFDSLSRFFADFYQGLNETLAFIQTPGSQKTPPVPDQPRLPTKTKDTKDAPQHREESISPPGRENQLPPNRLSESDGSLTNGPTDYRLDRLLQRLPPSQAGSTAPVNSLVQQSGGKDVWDRQAPSLIPAMSTLFHAAQAPIEAGARVNRLDTALSPNETYEQGVRLNTILDVLNRARHWQDDTNSNHEQISIKYRLITEFPELKECDTGNDKYFQAIRLYDALLSEPLAGDSRDSDIRALLKKLEIPLLKLALLDEKFLESDAHPARQTVNLFERYYLAADDSGKFFDPRLHLFLNRLVNRVIDNFEANPGIFVEVSGILENLLKPIENVQKKNVRRIQLISEGGEKIHLARDQVEQAIRLHLDKKAAPKIVLVILDAGWRHYLQTTLLRLGQESLEYQNALALINDLFDLLRPEVTANGIDPKKIQHMATYVLEKLVDTLFDETGFREITRQLVSQLKGENPVEFEFRNSAEPDAIPHPNPDNAIIRQLRKGDWLCFTQWGTPAPHQLIWLNAAHNRFVFTNRSATKKRHLDQHELEIALETGTAIRIPGMDAPFMERSAHKVMLDAYERLHHQATHDPETGLLNRKGLMNQLEKVFSAGVEENQDAILCLMMFDQLKAIYRSCDADEAEASLLSVVKTMSDTIQPTDIFSRVGDDAFAVLFRGRPFEAGYDAAQNMVSRIHEHRVKCQDKRFVLGVNAGIARLSREVDSPSTLLKQAGSACAVAKSTGGNLVQCYETDSTQIRDDQALFEWAGLIDKTLNENLLYLRCQKIQSVHSDPGNLPHYEILLGLHDSLNIQPAGFIRAAEQWKRSADIDQWVLRTSFNWIRKNARYLDSVAGFSINLSGLSLVDDNVLDFIHSVLRANELPSEKIIFEITENAAIKKLDAAQNFMDEIKTYGCQFSLDDFGSGYSSFAYLKGLKVDYLKIDGSFIRDLLKDRHDYAMVKSMHEVGHSLGLKTIAEYVESDAILEKVQEIGIDYAQGYAIEKPMPLHQLILE